MSDIKFVTRVEKHRITKEHSHFEMLDGFCFKSKNLYNFANYHIRQSFMGGDNKYISYYDMDKLLKQEGFDFDYRNMPSAQSAQQCLRLLDKNWKSFFLTIKDWSKNKDKYTGRPKLPKYLDKSGRNLLILTNSNCKVREGYVIFPKTFNGFVLKTRVDNLQQVRFLPRGNSIIIEVIYRKEIPELFEDNRRHLSIDIGIDNLATITNNIGSQPIIINGKHIKSINQYYNKKLSYYRSIAKRMNGNDWSNRLSKLTTNRNNMIDDKLHKASKSIIDYALSCEVTSIVIGNNKDWKRDSKLSKKVNQNFVGIPHQRFIEMIQYKAENVGIKVLLTEESYTSGTSFLDSEEPKKENYDKKRRKYRGLFISNEGKKINADVNGSLQIMKKVFPKAFSNGIVDIGLYPIRVTI